MNNKAIGIFDSGVGGLTVAKAVHKHLPAEDIIYFGDTVHLPYGNKSVSAIKRYSEQNASFLLHKGVKLIIIACNTASSVALKTLRRKIKVPVMSVLEPGCEAALAGSKKKKIGVIGTFRTVSSKAYTTFLKKQEEKVRVYEKACPLFVPVIEENFRNNDIVRMIIKEYLDNLMLKDIDNLILGCTHYPLIKDRIRELYPDIAITDSADATARKAGELLSQLGLERKKGKTKGKVKIYVNDKSEVFNTITKKLFAAVEARQVDFEE